MTALQSTDFFTYCIDETSVFKLDNFGNPIMLLLITVCGAIGVKVMISAVGSTIGPPQDRL